MGNRFIPFDAGDEPASNADHLTESTSGAEFDAALMQAESILDRVDRADLQVAKLYAVVVAVGATILVLAALLSILSVSGIGRAFLFLGGCIVTASVALASHRAAAPLRYDRARDERAMIEIVDVLREVLPFVSQREVWSTTRDQVARTRIARFPISVRGDR